MCITNIDIEGLIKDRIQLWAEAVIRFQTGEKWWLEGEDVQLAEQATAEVTMQSARIEPIMAWWSKLNHRPKYVTTLQVAQDALGLLVSQCTNGVQQEVGSALRTMGFTRGKERVGGVSKNVYHTPEALMSMGGPAKILDLVPESK